MHVYGVPIEGCMLKRSIRLKVWLYADVLLVVGSVFVLLALLVGLGRWRHQASQSEKAESAAAVAERQVSALPRAVAVPGGGAWVSYGGSAAAHGDRRLAWAEQGVVPSEWRGAPAAPAVNIEPCSGGYTVWCLLPECDPETIELQMAGDVLLVARTVTSSRSACLRFRLPGGNSKRIADSIFSNGWVRITVLEK